jgi:hypothetical protein
MPTDLTSFFNLLATPTFAAAVVLWLMKQVDMFAVLAPGPKRLVGILLSLLVSGVATAGLFYMRVILVIDANILFQVFMEAFLISQSLQLLTAPAALAPLSPEVPTDGVVVVRGKFAPPAPTVKFGGFGWW